MKPSCLAWMLVCLSLASPAAGQQFPDRVADAVDDLFAPSDWNNWATRSLNMGEPWGAEDKSAETHSPQIPEPMVFDLVRPLGEHRGAGEVNVLALFPLTNHRSRFRNTDPLGIVQVSENPHEIEWAPEFEYALADGFAIEFEFPFEGSTLEAYKLAAQYTLGTSADERYIHGVQTIIEPTTDFTNWNLVLLYLGGYRWSETWSFLGMIGGRTATGPGIEQDRTEMLINGTLFADVSPHHTIGFETNYAQSFDGAATFLLTPQLHWEITDHFQVQSGVGVGLSRGDVRPQAVLRVIYSF